MISASNMSEISTPYISSISWSRTTRSQPTGRGGGVAGIYLAWDYNDQHANRTCRISMNGYIEKVLLKYGHPRPIKSQLSPHKHCELIYCAKEQLTPEDDKSPPLDNQGTKSIQGIVGAFLYYGRELDNKLLVGLSSIGSQQVAATERTKESINKLLDYCATYPADGILYCSSNMVICAHSDAVFHNEIKGRSRSGAHVFIYRNDGMPRWNVPVITLSHIIKFAMSSTSEEELGALFITSQKW